MSLQVWLPLTKDLRNQGLDTIAVTTTNTNVFQNEGKMSNKSLDVSGHYAFSVPSLVKKRVFSCSFWYKPISNSSASDNWRKIIVFDTFTSDGSTTGAIFRFESSYGYQSSSTSYCISIHNNAGEPLALIGTSLGENDGWNKWQHITITADGTILKCYRNGIQIASGNMSNGGMLQGIVHIGYSGNRPIGRLNDFRLYDHCLSPMEVKQISQGLVLHYPLNRQGWGQENLISNSQLNGSWAYPSSSYSDKYSPTTLIVPNGSVYTLSFDAKSTVNGDKIRTHYYSPNTTTTCTSNQGVVKTASDGHMDFILTTSWKRYWVIYNQSETTAVKHIICPRLVSGNGTGTVSVRNVKFEEGSVATPWCPNSSDALATTMGLNSTTEYDCSGFENNGTLWAYDTAGVITYTSNTPKYQVSTYINSDNNTTNTASGTRYIYGNCELSAPQYLTVAFWCKPIAGYGNSTGQGQFSLTNYGIGSAAGQDYDTSPMNHRDSLIDMCTSTGTHKTVSIAFTANEWHHYVIVYDGRYGRIYKDGIATGATLDMGSILSLKDMKGVVIGFSKAGGVWRSNKSYYSDFRIYATALSTSDVKSLYQNSAYIDSSGNVYGAVHSEV